MKTLYVDYKNKIKKLLPYRIKQVLTLIFSTEKRRIKIADFLLGIVDTRLGLFFVHLFCKNYKLVFARRLTNVDLKSIQYNTIDVTQVFCKPHFIDSDSLNYNSEMTYLTRKHNQYILNDALVTGASSVVELKNGEIIFDLEKHDLDSKFVFSDPRIFSHKKGA
jgi:hypothetical protein